LAALGLILVAGLVLSAGAASRQWNAIKETARDQFAQLETGVSELGGKVLDTASSLAAAEGELATPTPTPVVVLAALPDDLGQAAAATQVIVLAPTTIGKAIGGVAGTADIGDVASAPAPELTSPAAQSPTPEPAAQATAADPTATPTSTQVPATPTPPPTPTPPAATPTRTTVAPPRATATPTRSVATPTRAAPTPTRVEPTRAAPTPTRVEPTRTVVAAAAASASNSANTYTVQAGDNWFSIAQRFGITQETLAAYNDSTPSDVLQVDQVLLIPPAGTVLTLPTATPTPIRPTPTPPATATPAPTPTPVIVMLAAPSLVAPMVGDGFTAGSQPVLSWRSVAGMGPQDYFHVSVRYTQRDGQPGFVEERVTATSYTVPMWVFDLAMTPDRLSTWSVQVRRMGADGQELMISPSSESRTFYWR
jgi:LysM repeat protein